MNVYKHLYQTIINFQVRMKIRQIHSGVFTQNGHKRKNGFFGILLVGKIRDITTTYAAIAAGVFM